MDQLAKLSSTAFMCTTIGNFMPSLGNMDDRNSNESDSLGYSRNYHSWDSLTVSTAKKHLQLKYSDLHQSTSGVVELEDIGMVTVQKLKDYVKKYWMMAETGGPQFVMARSVTCSASGAICSLTTLILAEAELRTYLTSTNYPDNFNSDYKLSNFYVLVFQTIGVGVGTINPVFGWFIAITFKCSVRRGKSYKTEDYWTRRLVDWRDSPLALRFRSNKFRKIVHYTKNRILNFGIGIQIVIVTANKSLLLISSFFPSLLFSCFSYCKVLKRKILSKSNVSGNHTRSESEPEPEPGTQLVYPSDFVLYLDGEEQMPLHIMKNISNATDHLIQIGKKKPPKFLKEILGKSTGLEGVADFDSNQSYHIPSLVSEEPPNCWTLPLVTLTSIARALPNIDDQKMEQLQSNKNESLLYVRQVEKILDSEADLVNIRNAAERVWLGVDIKRKWLDEDLRKFSLETSEETLKRLVGMAEVIAANSMYRISQSVLRNHEGSNNQTDDGLFKQLSVMIADILGACLTNLPRVKIMKCFCSAIEKRENSVQRAAQLLGETEETIEILQQREIPSLNPIQAANINEWRASMKK
ncbi:uncharacterized protein LOC132305393 [Cornus florida]|uniref:uncharacterized protein LOC132305393 n=1 Tax=Cornus florida TaxID=4283 RepID=UPI00289B96E9|nr:uncharacterized protein LOC132305393 [Cornus florida]